MKEYQLIEIMDRRSEQGIYRVYDIQGMLDRCDKDAVYEMVEDMMASIEQQKKDVGGFTNLPFYHFNIKNIRKGQNLNKLTPSYNT